MFFGEEFAAEKIFVENFSVVRRGDFTWRALFSVYGGGVIFKGTLPTALQNYKIFRLAILDQICYVKNVFLRQDGEVGDCNIPSNRIPRFTHLFFQDPKNL